MRQKPKTDAMKAVKAAKSSARRPIMKPTVTKPKLSLDQAFPEASEFGNPTMWNRVMEFVTSAESRRHKSLQLEMKLLYALSLHFIKHKPDFDQFCEMRDIKPKSKLPAGILAEVLFEYTGREKHQKKDASRYKKRLLPSLEKKLTVKAFDALMTKVGGVLNLIPPKQTKRKRGMISERPAGKGSNSSDENVVLINKTSNHFVRLKRGSTQTIVIISDQADMSRFDIKVTRNNSKIATEKVLTASNDQVDLSAIDIIDDNDDDLPLDDDDDSLASVFIAEDD